MDNKKANDPIKIGEVEYEITETETTTTTPSNDASSSNKTSNAGKPSSNFMPRANTIPIRNNTLPSSDDDNSSFNNQNRNNDLDLKDKNPALGQRKFNNNSSLDDGEQKDMQPKNQIENNDNKPDSDNSIVKKDNNVPNTTDNNPAVPDKKNDNPDGNKSVNNDNKQDNKSTDSNDNNNNKSSNTNPLPGGVNDKKPTTDKKESDANKNSVKPKGDSDAKFEPKRNIADYMPGNLAKNLKSKLGFGNKDDDKGDKKVLPAQLAEGLKKLWVSLPLSVKVSIGTGIIVMVIVLVILLFVVGTTFMTGSDMCQDESNYVYEGSADVMEFMCKMQSPVKNYSVTSKFGMRIHPIYGDWRMHTGIDLAVTTGTPVYAPQAGEVVVAGVDGGYGYAVVIKHAEGLYTRFGHNSELLVSKNDKVTKGQLIAKAGSSGNSTGPHGHFEIIKGNNLYDGFQDLNDYFLNHEEFKASCGSMWEGDDADATYVNSYADQSFNSQCCVTTSTSSSDTGNYCPNGVTVRGLGTYSLDDYIAGVVQHENVYIKNNNIEAMKANAVAARTYLISHTDNCSSSIGNSQSEQTFSTNPNQYSKRAAIETSGQVMLYEGKIFSAQYDAFCMNDSDCPDATCNSNSCTVSYRKVPSTETHKITLYKGSSLFESIYSGSYNGMGHAHGMSQIVARQMQDEGKKYDEILKYFYADGIEITGTTNTCNVTGDSFKGDIYKFYQNDYSSHRLCGTSATIASNGCVPTSTAVIVSSLLGKKIDPPTICKDVACKGYCSAGGCNSAMMWEAARLYGGMNTPKRLSGSDGDEVLAQLNRGDTMVMALMIHPNKDGFANGADHAIVIYGTDGKGNVSVWDPYKSHRSKTIDSGSSVNDVLWPFKSTFNASTVSGFVVVSKK